MKITIRKRMMDIARKEGMNIEDNAMDTLIESVGNDIRQVLNALQMISRSKSKVSIRYSDMKERIKTISKDSILRMTPFTGVQEVFNRKKPFNRRYESFFVDYSLIPLMVTLCVRVWHLLRVFTHITRNANSNTPTQVHLHALKAVETKHRIEIIVRQLISKELGWR